MIGDFRYAARSLRRSGLFGGAAFVSIAALVAVLASLASIWFEVFQKSLDVDEPDRLVALSLAYPDRPAVALPVPVFLLDGLHREAELFSTVAAWRDALLRNVEVDGVRRGGTVNEVSADFFSAFNIAPLLGRTLTSADYFADGRAAAVAVLDYRAWQQLFGGRPDAVGETIVVDGTPLRVVGVMPERFIGVNVLAAPTAIVPIGFDGTFSPMQQYFVLARLQPDVSPESARARLEAIWERVLEDSLPAALPPPVRTRTLSATIGLNSIPSGTTGGDQAFRARLVDPLRRLAILSAVVALAASLNVLAFVLSRTASRRNELLLRTALGATAHRAARPLVFESVVLCATAGITGIVLAVWMGPFLLRMLTPYESVGPLLLDTRPQAGVMAAGLAFSLLVGALPAHLATRTVTSTSRSLRSPIRVVDQHASPFQGAIIAGQIALAILLTTGAVLFGRDLQQLRAIEAGVSPDRLFTMQLFPQVRQQEIPDRVAYYAEVSRTLNALPGVESVAFTQPSPYEPSVTLNVNVRGTGAVAPARVAMVGPEFFDTLAIPLLAGRAFGWSDTDATSGVAVVSEDLARDLFGETWAIGQTIDVAGHPFGSGVEIVGVAGGARVWGLRDESDHTVYLALLQMPPINNFAIGVRTAIQPGAVMPAAARALESLGHQYSYRTESVGQQASRALGTERILANVGGFFSMLSVAIAAIGLFGILSYSVASRRSEIAIRAALGATPRQITSLLLATVGRPVLIGGIAGIGLAIAAVRVITARIQNLHGADVWTYSLAAGFVLASVSLAAWFAVRQGRAVATADCLRIDGGGSSQA